MQALGREPVGRRMETSSYILFALGFLGAVDIAVYHSFAHGIRHHQSSRNELIVHSLRGPTYAALFVLVPNVHMHGVFFWGLISLFFVDLVISVVDFALERKSRQFIGGLPSGEYVLHMLIAMFFGALVTSVWISVSWWSNMPTELLYYPADVPWILRAVMGVMAILVFLSGVQDLVAAVKLTGRPPLLGSPSEQCCPPEDGIERTQMENQVAGPGDG